MRTTIDLSDDVYRKAKALAARRGTTLRALIEAALRRELARNRAVSGFQLEDRSVGGKGLRAGVDARDLRELAYEGIE